MPRSNTTTPQTRAAPLPFPLADYADDALFDTATACIILGGVSHQWMELGRYKGYGPRYIKVTKRLVRYRKGDLIEYMQKRGTQPQWLEEAASTP